MDTESVEPLQSIRDETKEGIREATIGLKDVKDALDQEEFKGSNKRPRRRRGPAITEGEVDGWDVFGTAGETIEVRGARFFVVRSGKDESPEGIAKDEPSTKQETLPRKDEVDGQTSESRPLSLCVATA